MSERGFCRLGDNWALFLLSKIQNLQTLSKQKWLEKVLLRLHSSSNQRAAHEICCAFTHTEKTPVLLLGDKIFHIDAKTRKFSVMLVLPKLVKILIFKMAVKKTILFIISIVKQNTMFRWTCYCSVG